MPPYPDDPPPSRPLADPAVRRVAVVRLRTGLGDLLCTVPSLRALRRDRPDVEVTLVTFAEMAPVVERMSPWVDELLAFPGWHGIPERPPDTGAIPAFLAEAERRRFDVAIQAYGAAAAANRVTEALSARTTCGFVTPGAHDADLRTHLPYPTHAHEVDRLGLLFGFLGTGPIEPRLEMPLIEADLLRADALRRRHGMGRYAIVHAGATASSRRWPLERYAAVADGLRRRGLDVVLTGVAAERELVSAVRHHMDTDAVDGCGCTDLGTFAALVAGADVVVSSETGTAQVAIATGAPSVTIFLSGDPSRWSGRSPRHVHLVGGVTCQPCGLLACPIDHRCATTVTPNDVLAAADRLLDPAGRYAARAVNDTSVRSSAST